MGALVKLPTAAPRKVQGNTRTRAKRSAAALLPQFPKGHYIEPRIRAALPDARNILDADQATFQVLAQAIFRALDTVDRGRVQIFLAMASERSEAAKQALSLIRFDTAPAWQQFDIRRAIEMIENGEVE